MKETQESIAVWADETFGPVSLFRAIVRVNEEMSELLTGSCYQSEVPGEISGECADILITLYRVAEYAGIDLHAAVDAKMKVNRARVWKKDGSGCGYHV